MRLREYRGQSGFTLIELMIVIAIIAIIAAIAIPNLLDSRKNRNESRAIGNMRVIVTTQAMNDIEQLPDVPDILGGVSLHPDSSYVTGEYVYKAALDVANFWHVISVPQSSGAGTARFFIDATGVMRVSRDGTTPGSTSTPLNGIPVDEQEPTEAAESEDLYAESRLAFWDLLPTDSVDEVAWYLEQLMNEELVQSMIQELDEDQDGIVQVSEIEAADIVQAARALQQGVDLPGGPIVSDDDEVLIDFAEGFKQVLLDLSIEFADSESEAAEGDILPIARAVAGDLDPGEIPEDTYSQE